MRHGGVEPRVGPGPRRRVHVRRRGVPQPGARPPRLPQGPRGLLPRQGRAVHARARAPRGHQHRRPPRPPAARADAVAGHDVLDRRQSRRLASRQHPAAPPRHGPRGPGTRRARDRPLGPATWRLQRLQCPLGHRRVVAGRASTPRSSPRASPRAPECPDVWSASRQGSRSRRSSTTPTSPTPSPRS